MGRLSKEGRAWSEAIIDSNLRHAAITGLHPEFGLTREEFLELARAAFDAALLDMDERLSQGSDPKERP
jgi:hypothetical protein